MSLVVVAATAISASAQNAEGTPHLQKQGAATQLIVDGQPYLALAGELTNNAATSLPMMEPIWPKVVAANLNTVLVGVAWGQFEPEEGKFNYTQVDGVIAKARENHLHIVFLWFGAWKNGTSSYPPYWVKKDYIRFPRIQVDNGSTVSVSGPVETLSALGDATRDADAAAFAALMRHIKEVDGSTHTVIMMQVENEVGVLRDSRDRSPAANRAFAGPVPAELMNYLESHKDSLISEFRQVWADNGYRKSGTWEQVFGSGKPVDLKIPIQTTTPPMSAFEHEVSWRELHWPSDEIFMAWNYARYVEALAKAGKAAYDIPMYVNAWLQQPNHAWPGTYPSGGPLPQVHDVWRAGAPDIDILSPDLYVPYFDELCERFTRGGNPLFIPETGTSAANVVMAVGKYNTIGFSPFGIDGNRPIPPELAAAYQMLEQMSPVILAHQGTDSITAVRMLQGAQPKQVRLGDYTLTFTYTGRNQRVPPQAKGGVEVPSAMRQFMQVPEDRPSLEAAAVVVSTAPNEYYFGGGGMRVDFTPNTPGPQNAGLGVVEQGRFVDGKWEVTRWIAGDDDAQGEILVLHPDSIVRVQVYRFP